MKQTILTALASVLMLSACATGSQTESPEPPKVLTFNNPIIKTSLPDPTVVRAPDGHFYLYATEDVHHGGVRQACLDNGIVESEHFGRLGALRL